MIFGFANVDFHVNLHLAALWGGGGTHFELIEKSNNSKLKIPNRSKLDQNGPKGV